jgi:hypothetical protein
MFTVIVKNNGKFSQISKGSVNIWVIMKTLKVIKYDPGVLKTKTNPLTILSLSSCGLLKEAENRDIQLPSY